MGNMFSINRLTDNTNNRIVMESSEDEETKYFLNMCEELISKSRALVDETHDIYNKLLENDADGMVDNLKTFYSSIKHSEFALALDTANIGDIIERDKGIIMQFKDSLEAGDDVSHYRLMFPDYPYNISTRPIREMIKELELELGATNRNQIINDLPEQLSGEYFDRVRGFTLSKFGESINKNTFNDMLTDYTNLDEDDAHATSKNLDDIVAIMLDVKGYLNGIQNEYEEAVGLVNQLFTHLDKLYHAYIISEVLDIHEIIHLYNRLVQANEVINSLMRALYAKADCAIDGLTKTYWYIVSCVDADSVFYTKDMDTVIQIEDAFTTAITEVNDIRTSRFRQEYIAFTINESNGGIVYDLESINEATGDKIKETVNNLVKKIKNIFDKFKESVTKLVLNDKKYLAKYKSIILNKPMRESTYEMYDFNKGISIMNNATVPAFNYSSLKDSLGSEEEFIDRYFSKYKVKDMSFSDGCKLTFRGSAKKVNMSSNNLSLKQMYEFCLNYDKIVDRLKGDMDAINKAGNEAIKIIDSVKVNTESVKYSALTESVIYEADDNKPESGGIKKVQDEESNARKENNNKVNSDIDNIMVYMRVCQNFLGSKMNVLQEVYKGYMFIIRDHIKSHIGTRDTSKKNKDADGSNMKNVEENYLFNGLVDAQSFLEGINNIINSPKHSVIKDAIIVNENFNGFDEDKLLYWNLGKVFDNPDKEIIKADNRLSRFTKDIEKYVELNSYGINCNNYDKYQSNGTYKATVF